MLDAQLLIDAYGLQHKVSWFWPLFWGIDLFDTNACIKALREAQGRDIVMQYPKESVMNGWSVYDGGRRVYEWEIDPEFDFKRFLDRVEENEEEIRKKLGEK